MYVYIHLNADHGYMLGCVTDLEMDAEMGQVTGSPLIG